VARPYAIGRRGVSLLLWNRSVLRGYLSVVATGPIARGRFGRVLIGLRRFL